ncbi:pentatricopeptide repeat-containing protein At3g04750, mitochondrial-like [Carica papaya]|uniref:pentatricopeptide repeat-containing protein At3g04750, mitochondrial-like n=1 Tax=Carica papaya TaxID=3649 RepID=UPI000B8CE5B0|nr:pentatricopeptide repeat-containing protein At3g04750, mitochondrial-like [Carica papaya]
MHRLGDYMIVRDLFNNMVAENIMPDNLTMVNLVSAVAEAGALDEGRRIHGWIVRMSIEVDAFLGAALIDMYCKCGSIERAFMVFKSLTEKDVTVWTAMITGFAFHGYGNKALELFAEMQKHVMPNNVTLVAILTACSHSGLLDLGLKIFNTMNKNYGIQPEIKHYGCLVDLLGRSGRLAEAKDVVEKMPMKPSRSIWGTILSACRAHGNLEMAETALTELLKLEPEKEGGYILLSNMYASKGNWSYSDKIRELMVRSRVKKTAGCSSLVVDGAIHNFVAADNQHPEWRDIKYALNNLHDMMNMQQIFLRTYCNCCWKHVDSYQL